LNNLCSDGFKIIICNLASEPDSYLKNKIITQNSSHYWKQYDKT